MFGATYKLPLMTSIRSFFGRDSVTQKPVQVQFQDGNVSQMHNYPI